MHHEGQFLNTLYAESSRLGKEPAHGFSSPGLDCPEPMRAPARGHLRAYWAMIANVEGAK